MSDNAVSEVISSVEKNARDLRITWADGHESRFHHIWLRDNCRCDSCGDPAIGYRDLRTTSIDPDCGIADFATTAERLQLTWSDGHRSSYASDWLRMHAYDDESRREPADTWLLAALRNDLD